MRAQIEKMREKLSKEGADGWLIFDHHGSNRLAHRLLSIPAEQVFSRRFFYWVPKEGEPQKILHRIESENLDYLPGKKHLYLSWQELHERLKEVLKGVTRVLMEYSPKGAIPSVSLVDAGTVEIIRALGIEVVSSQDILQNFTSVLDEEQIASHLEAASVVKEIAALSWAFIAERIKNGERISEWDVQQRILEEIEARGFETTLEPPICAVNENSALPHYTPTWESAREIKKGDFILIDLWCKKKIPNSIYADITQVAVLRAEPTKKEQEIFNIVLAAQKKAFDFVKERMESQKVVRGFEVDECVRSYIKECGYGEQFTHRTGHNIDQEVHGAGANFDNLETFDQRELLPGMCFSVEPGIYLSNEFGIRLESNLLIKKNRSVEITGGVEESLICLA